MNKQRSYQKNRKYYQQQIVKNLKYNMKKLTLLVALLTVISAASFADGRKIGESSEFKMIAKSEVKYDLSYESVISSDVCVTIFNEEGDKVSSKTVKATKKFKRTYDFSKLKAGKYTVEVRNEDGTANQEVVYGKRAVKLNSFVSKIPQDKSLKLLVGDFNPNKDVTVKIYNQNNKLIHSEKIKNEKSFSRVYNLNNTIASSVNVLIENDGELQTFTHDLR